MPVANSACHFILAQLGFHEPRLSSRFRGGSAGHFTAGAVGGGFLFRGRCRVFPDPIATRGKPWLAGFGVDAHPVGFASAVQKVFIKRLLQV